MLGILGPAPGLIVHSAEPLNAEPPLDRLRSSFLTSTADFYIRTHGDVPKDRGDDHRITIAGLVDSPRDISVAGLKQGFEPKTVMAVMQCAGNRRADLQQVCPTSGDPWAPGAIGNAEWTGAALADVLRSVGARRDQNLHVAFEGLDMVDTEGGPAPYGVSIPLPKALSGDVLLAYAMNGEPLTPEHGSPLRVLVPGFAGVRSVKWLRHVRVQDGPSDAHQQQRDYLLFPPDMRKETQDFSRGMPIYEMPLNSAICEPQPGATLAKGKVKMRGYAIATGRAVTRVDFSVNGGRDWGQATIEDHADQPWSWTFWHATVDLSVGEHELVVRAWDAAGQTQPANPDDTWNFKGYLSAAWHPCPGPGRVRFGPDFV